MGKNSDNGHGNGGFRYVPAVAAVTEGSNNKLMSIFKEKINLVYINFFKSTRIASYSTILLHKKSHIFFKMYKTFLLDSSYIFKLSPLLRKMKKSWVIKFALRFILGHCDEWPEF